MKHKDAFHADLRAYVDQPAMKRLPCLHFACEKSSQRGHD